MDQPKMKTRRGCSAAWLLLTLGTVMTIAGGCSQRSSLTWAQTTPAIDPLPPTPAPAAVNLGVIGRAPADLAVRPVTD